VARRSDWPRVGIIGSGFSGLCVGIQLRKAGIDSFTIFEKGAGVGGTWRDNTYPGAACDTPAISYCFSFEPKSDWSRKWAEQPEILAYLESCASKYRLTDRIRLRTEIASARWDDRESECRVTTRGGEVLAFDVLVSAVGQLHRPAIPDLPGLADFGGAWFHSARWDHGCDLRGKDVAVVGNAASAVQLVPEIAKRARTMHVFQRSANWMIPKKDRRIGAREHALFTRFPALVHIARSWTWASYEIRVPVLRDGSLLRPIAEWMAGRHLRAQIGDPHLRSQLVPDYPIGGKRILISDDYYPTLERPNVRLVRAGIERVTREALVTVDGRSHRSDVIVFATGFDTTSFLAPMAIEGDGGRLLSDAWRDGAEAYLGMSVAGFPNLFLTYGPNTNLGHNSIVFMIECQTRYIVDCLRQMQRRDLASVDVRADVMAEHNRRLQAELAGSVWARTGKTWYKNERGRITNNWPGSSLRYWWLTRRADLRAYHQRAAEP
jgi:cation diffusion facilitator CzcD-associated flavoprotein CzcO